MFENCNSSLNDLLDVEIRIDRPPKRNKKVSPKLEKRRKFPGPAGFLPENLEDESFLHENSFQEENDEKEEEIEVANQVHFLGNTWKQVSQEFGVFINKFNINYIKTNLLPNDKMPFLAAIVVHRDSFKGKIPIIMLTLKDLTGEVKSLIHHELYEEYLNEFAVGNVVVLRDFSVLNMSYGRSHCITITRNNLLTIYSLKEIYLNQPNEIFTQMPMRCERIDVQHFERSTINNLVNSKIIIEDSSTVDSVGTSMLKKENIFESNQNLDNYDIVHRQFQAKKAKLDEVLPAKVKHKDLNAELDDDLHLFDEFDNEIPEKLSSILKKKPNTKHQATSSADFDDDLNDDPNEITDKLTSILNKKEAVLDGNLDIFDELPNEIPKIVPSSVNKISFTDNLPDKENNMLDNNRKADDAHKVNLKSKLKSFRFLAKVNTNEPRCVEAPQKSVSQIFEDTTSGLDCFFSDF